MLAVPTATKQMVNVEPVEMDARGREKSSKNADEKGGAINRREMRAMWNVL